MRQNQIDYKNLKEVDANNPCITRVGHLLRQYGIDELPQLLNIFKGEMSFVGPRPTIKEQVDNYTSFQRRRLEVRPGLTGLAQVSGNTSLAWNDRIKLDVWYIDHWSLKLDFMIIFRTISVVFKGQVMGQAIEQAKFLPSLLQANQYAESLEING